MPDRLLLVEDRENLRALMAKGLGARFDVEAVGDGTVALQCLHERSYSVVVTDVRLPGAGGLEILAAARALDRPPEVIVLTGYAEVPAAVAALKAGAYEYLAKPVAPEDLLKTAMRASERFALVQRARELEAIVEAGESGFIGRSAVAVELRRRVERAGRLPAPVVLVGEPGSGKEVAAREIHKVRTAGAPEAQRTAGAPEAQRLAGAPEAQRTAGPPAQRTPGPFLALSCGGVSEAWLEAELFGRAGLFGERHGGRTGGAESGGRTGGAEGGGRTGGAEQATLFLDDVDELPATLQAKLIRALGDGDPDADQGLGPRVIAATARDLERLVHDGTFRRDLYFWLNVVHIRIPPLRERPEDIALFAARFLHLAGVRFGTSARRLSPGALATLEGAAWPGNVRELRHAIEQAATAAEGDVVEVEHLPESLRGIVPFAPPGTYRAAVERAADAGGRDYLTQVVRSAGGNVTRAAIEAGVERETLHRLLKKHGVDPARFRP